MSINFPEIKIDEVGKILDETISTDQERDSELTERLRLDMTSPFKLPQYVRPILAFWAAGLFTIVIGFYLFDDTVDPVYVIGAVSSVLFSIIGFYFDSRKREKIASNNANAAVKIKLIETKAAVLQEKLDKRAARKAAKKAARKAQSE